MGAGDGTLGTKADASKWFISVFRSHLLNRFICMTRGYCLIHCVTNKESKSFTINVSCTYQKYGKNLISILDLVHTVYVLVFIGHQRFTESCSKLLFFLSWRDSNTVNSNTFNLFSISI